MTDANRLARDVAFTAALIPTAVAQAVDAIRWRLRDGYPSGSGGRRSAPSDRTAAAALSNTHGTGEGYGPLDHHDYLLLQLTIAQAALQEVLSVANRYRGNTVTEQPPRCSGGHLAGSHVPLAEGGWYDPTCGEDAELWRRQDGSYGFARDGLCSNCARRRRRKMAGIAA